MPLLYPTTEQIDREIVPAVSAKVTAGRLGLDVMPVIAKNTGIIRWTQKDAYRGLQQLAGLDNSPYPVSMVGANVYQFDPGVFREFTKVGETELTQMTGSLQGDMPVDLTDWTIDSVEYLMNREYDRIEQIIWTLLGTGTFTISSKTGVEFGATYALQTYDASTWGTAGTATPVADFRAVSNKGFGKGVDFGGGAVAYCNRVTANKMLANTNANDLKGLRDAQGASIFGLGQVNTVFSANDLPTLRIYDNGYIAENGTATRFIPDNKVIVVGSRPDSARVGEYWLTRNSAADFQPGSYSKIIDNADRGEVVPTVEVHRGHNGGPVVYLPGSVVVMDVS